MINNTLWIGLCGVLMLTATSCGFKSDLYLPGQPQKPEQYDSDSLKNLGDEKLRQMQNQNDVDDTETNSESTIGDNAGSDSEIDIPDDGVMVELPSANDIVRDRENPDHASQSQNATKDKVNSRKKVSTEN